MYEEMWDLVKIMASEDELENEQDVLMTAARLATPIQILETFIEQRSAGLKEKQKLYPSVASTTTNTKKHCQQ